ncbi:hypothetical protein, partial [Actinomadura sp. CNU-125]|uniref:hypothetical protein n=1 Tax=Actinomadura sp. CNU-125 TaxID=1904961 RepID=UPI000B1774C4
GRPRRRRAAVGPPDAAPDPGTTELVRSSIRELRRAVRDELARIDPDDDGRAPAEVVEDELETRIRRSPDAARIVEALLAAVRDRFELLGEGELRRDDGGWPVSWTWRSDDRAEFLRVITRFSSNQAAFFGHLLTPLVDGLRVAGPFRPRWAGRDARLVLIDGEGLGHTPGSAAEVSTRLRRRLDEVDAIVLVDNAQQPMQAAPVAVMRTAAATGNGGKLFFVFTHFDLVKGDNLRSFPDRERHVLGSAENVLGEVREELGIAERVLRRRLDEARFFVGGIDRLLAPDLIDPARPRAPAARSGSSTRSSTRWPRGPSPGNRARRARSTTARRSPPRSSRPHGPSTSAGAAPSGTRRTRTRPASTGPP